MATLADLLRSGYKPPTESALADPIKEHFRNLPQTLETNQRAMDKTIAGMNKTDIMGRPNPNYYPEAMQEFTQNYLPNIGALTAWHGTPHKILGKFDINKVGTGEGAQAYGHGMYFAQAKPVAETYKRAGSELNVSYAKPLEELGINPKVATNSMDFDENPVNQGLGRIAKGLRTTALDYPDVPLDQKLVKEQFDEYIRLLDDKYPKEAAQKKALQDLVAKEGYPDINFGGNLYKVDIPDEYIPNMLDWDKPLLQQTPQVQEALAKLGIKTDKQKLSQFDDALLDALMNDANKILPKQPINPTGQDIYQTFVQGSPQFTSQKLNEAGITGIRYKDAMSRGADEGTSNFVVFDPSTVKILEENGIPTRKELIQQQIDKIE
jgi:hypothetical protein